MSTRVLSIAPVCAVVLAGAALPALAADAPPSLRIVIEGRPQPASYRKNISLALHVCQLSKGLPKSDAGLPSEAELANFKMEVEERLLDGPMAGRYVTRSEVMPDPSQACKLRVARNYWVEIDKTCSWQLKGGASVFETDGPGRAMPLTEERYGGPGCTPTPKIRPAIAAAEAKAPRHAAGLGAQCVWDSDVMAILSGTPTGSRPEGGCQWADMTVYPYADYRGQKRAVYLTHELSDETRGGTRLSDQLGGVAAAFKGQLVAFDKDAPIAKERFNRSGAESFLGRPRWVELGDAK